MESPDRTGPKPRRKERGAILVLTSISMVVLMAFTAFAVDIGQRNQESARAQHAIDAAVLAAAQYLSVHDQDYAGASNLIKELMTQNLGISAAEWNGCLDAQALDTVAPSDTNCISFRRNVNPIGQVKHDIRVKLPNVSIDTIFGNALGIGKLNLTASASANGANCNMGDPGCGPGGSSTTTDPGPTTTISSTTTTVPKTSCDVWGPLSLVFNLYTTNNCGIYYPGFDYTNYTKLFCTQGLTTVIWNGVPIQFNLSLLDQYVYYWNVGCKDYLNAGDRTGWLNTECAGTMSVIYSNYNLWLACTEVRPGLEDWYAYYATSTTAPTTTSATSSTSTTTTITIPISTPTSIDISG